MAETARLVLDINRTRAGFSLAADVAIPLEGSTALFGPSGSGKTTMLRAIAGLDRDVEGRIRLAGETLLDSAERVFVPPHKRRVGLVFQDARLFAHLNVADNLTYAARRSGVPAMDDVIDGLDLSPLLKREPASLSGGERQRTALGRTLLTRPRLLLLDEPLAGLDGRRKAAILPYLSQLTSTFGIPAIYVSHALDEVTQLSSNLVAIDAGRIIGQGPTMDMLDRTEIQRMSGRFDAGTMVSARVTGQDQHFRLTIMDVAGETLSMPMINDLAPGDTLRLRIRARDVSLAVARPKGISIRNVLATRIASIIEEEGTAFAEVILALGDKRLRARITRASAAELSLVPDMQVFALIKSVAFDRRGLAAHEQREK